MEQKKFIDRNDALLIFIVAIITAVASEVKVIPFEGAPFRFGLGTVMFFFGSINQPFAFDLCGICHRNGHRAFSNNAGCVHL
ncbi:hypothetical protein P4476_06070 [Ureibacillus terrenus]|uniref:hypothetical protein n=1 Tax=Ureibacillus terrenus TaxID=118246 RepID=UPI002E1AE9AD|nr:hypothetical protein [Ureibacillus terrenus]